MLATITPARSASPTRASAASAGRRNSCSLRAARQKRNECPACAWTASATLSSALKSENSDVIWNVRARPSALRRCTGSEVMSRSANSIRPDCGAISPAIWLTSVVLPAPFGPMTACSSPSSTASAMSSQATTPPKRRVSPSMRSSVSVTRGAPQQPVDATAGEQDDDQEQRTEQDLPVFGDTGENLFQHQERHRADERPEHRPHAAEHHHDDEVARAGPVHHGRADEIRVVGKQRAGQSAHRPGNDEAREAITVSGKADRSHAPFVGTAPLDHHAEARIGEPRDRVDRDEKQDQAQIVELDLVRQV